MSTTHSPSLAPGAHLGVRGLSKSYPDRRVLTDVSFTVSQAERIAVIGENGSGKSTLLRLVAGAEPADAGEVSAPGRVGLLWQRRPFAEDATLAEVCDAALSAPRAILREFELATEALARDHEDATAEQRYADALARANHAEVWTLGHRAELVLDGVGLGAVPRAQRVGDLSGGQQARLALAWLLLSRPDTLLLDEPTNHLDDAAINYLVEVLRQWPGPVLLASHDRAFLDEVATGIIDLDPAPRPNALVARVIDEGPTSAIGVTAWTGGFSDYLRARQDEYERWQRRYEAEQDELDQLERRVSSSHQVGHVGAAPRTEARGAKKFYADRNATVVSRRVTDARARLQELRDLQVRKPPARLSFAGLTAAPRVPHVVPSVVAVLSRAGVEGRLVPTSLAVGRSQKWLVTGANGSGKSTLLSLLDASLAPTSGSVTVPRQVTVARLGQDIDPAPDLGVGAAYRQAVGAERAELVPLGTFGLVHPRDFSRSVGDLSVGQQRRLALSIVLADPPDLLLLDEPTNHFSLALAAELESDLADYPGAVVVASHDRWLRRRWTGERLHLGG
ncbi:ATP-binding cassette domain-containing protein [Propionibacteriaceae bacterium Y1923]|uniref:ATP-binding cassette domain-containing protein n=1 Tax=Aestuariimicrobium sp. Y1814 TaxID=3418742 RepID=UPI003C23A232